MSLEPWYKVETPREDLREGPPLDASEFAVHLDHVREGRAPGDYQGPEREEPGVRGDRAPSIGISFRSPDGDTAVEGFGRLRRR
jgi:hypothetical protein